MVKRHGLYGEIDRLKVDLDMAERRIEVREGEIQAKTQIIASLEKECAITREAATWLLRRVSGKTMREAGFPLQDSSNLDEFIRLFNDKEATRDDHPDCRHSIRRVTLYKAKHASADLISASHTPLHNTTEKSNETRHNRAKVMKAFGPRRIERLRSLLRRKNKI